MKTLWKTAASLSLLSVAILSGCGQSEHKENQIKVGVIAGAESQVAEVAAKVAKEKYGLDVELITFTDYITPNAALDDGSIDVNAFQHKPYLDEQIKDRNYPFVIAGNTFVYPIAGYSKKIKDVKQLADKAKIAVPNDPTNLGRALLLLEKQGLITLRDGAGIQATVGDISSNPKSLDIIELDANQLPRALDDVELAVINTTYASSIGLVPEKDGIFIEDKESPYVNLIVTTAEKQHTKNVKEFVQAYQTEDVYKAAYQIFNGGVSKGW